MKALVVMVAVVAAACGGAARNAAPEVAASPAGLGGGGLAPGSCAEARIGALTPPGSVPAVRGMQVGLSIQKGMETYRIEDVRVELLRPDAVLDPAPGEPHPIFSRRNAPLRAVEQRDLPAADRSVAFTFDGRDGTGQVLAPGRYPVVFYLATQPAGLCVGHGGGWSSSGVLTTLDWRG
jgi:hypothetical protein